MSHPLDLGPEDPNGKDPEAPEPELIVVPYRPGRGAGRYLPPLLIVLLGAAFLAYRSRSADWRGISALFERRFRPAATAPAPTPPEAPQLARAAEPKAPDPPAVAPAETTKADPAPPSDAPKAEEKAAPKDAAADPLADIQREAEKTRERIAELEKLKEREAQKLDETAPERELNDRFSRRDRMVDQMLRAQRQLLQRQMAAMAEMQRRFFNGRVPRGFEMPMLDMPAPDMLMPMIPPLLPRAGPPVHRGPAPGAAPNGQPRERVWRDPRGGVARFREFQGPGGMHGFEMRWEGPGLPQGGFAPVPAPDDDDPPPPPTPDPRVNRPRRRVFD